MVIEGILSAAMTNVNVPAWWATMIPLMVEFRYMGRGISALATCWLQGDSKSLTI